MRQISIKKLNKHLSAELKSLPFEITKNGKVLYEVNAKDTDNLPEIAKKRSKPAEPQKLSICNDTGKSPLVTGGRHEAFFNPRPESRAK